MKTFLFFIFFVSFITIEANAQLKFSSKRLEEIYNNLPNGCKKDLNLNLSKGTSLQVCKINDKTIILSKTLTIDSIISHLGVHLIDTNLLDSYPIHLVEFVERTILENIIFSDDTQFINKNKENGVKLLVNGKELSKERTTIILSIIPKLLDTASINFNKSQLRSSVKIEKGYNTLELQFPTRFSSIIDMDIEEYGDYIFTDLCNYNKSVVLDENNDKDNMLLRPYGQEIWKNCGISYDSLYFSDTYFYLKDSSLEAVFSRVYEQESFFNTFLLAGNHNRAFELELEFQLYNKKKSCTIKLLDFLAYFERDFNAYFGILNIDDKVMEGVLLLQNKYYNYINLLNVKADKGNFFNAGDKLKCKFFFNIPTDNIKNLFADE